MRFFIRLLALCYPISSYAAETYQFNLTIDAYSAPVSIHAFTSDWHDDLKSGDSAFLHGLAELSRENEQRKISSCYSLLKEQAVHLNNPVLSDRQVALR